MSSILLVPVPPVDRELISDLVQPLRRAFAADVSVHTAGMDPSCAFDSARNQYNSTFVISAVLEQFGGNTHKVLGVTSLDLFVPVLTFVFGEAQLDGTAAMVSTYRLDETLYGLSPNRELLRERLIKEAVHELGHTFGLIHCRSFECVMHSSTSVEEIDAKGAEMCPACRAAVMPPIDTLRVR
jgi:archaemetzincin